MFKTPAHVPRTFLSLQYLRAAASIAVIAGHSMFQIQRYQPGYFVKPWEAGAVDVFFVLSGFVMWHMAAGETMSLGEYARRRFARVVPFYWLINTFFVIVLLAAPHLMTTARFDIGHVLASYVFLPWPHPVNSTEILPLIIPGWTFEYEIFFYVLLGSCLFLPLRRRALALIAMIVGVVAVPLVIQPKAIALQFFTQTIFIEFASGVALGWLVWNNRIAIRSRLGVVLGLAAFGIGCVAVRLLPAPLNLVPVIGDWHGMAVRVAWYCVPAFLIVGGLLSAEVARGGMPKWGFLKTLGDASYSVYIIHSIIVAAMTRLWSGLGLMQHPACNLPYILLVVAASCGLGVACHKFVELPVGKWSARLLSRPDSVKPSTLAAAPAILAAVSAR